jgi:predicted DNA-binding transcriptional regulator AlpA
MGKHRRIELVKVPTAAKILGIREGTLYNWISKPRNKMPKYVKIGRGIFFDKADLYRFIEDQKVDPSIQS